MVSLRNLPSFGTTARLVVESGRAFPFFRLSLVLQTRAVVGDSDEVVD